ncbi:Vacuolar ATP synthase subunit C [Ascosphaera pollenicola]|nr:Vacuolar ATP synthase subunit C [Ascosphaera pollenicola]
MPDVSGMRRASWPPTDENQVPGPPVDQHGQGEYYPAVAPIDRSPLVNYIYNAVPQMQQQCLPFQMMKSGSGYVIQDIDALLRQEPPIPRAVPAMWTNPNELTLAKCLENREGITNVYIRGFPPETTDEMLHAYAARFGKIDRCKAIADLDTGKCKGFGFVQFYSFEACENCIRGFFHLGYQASFAQKSRNSRLKDLEDKSSTNIYCTNVPIEWTEADLRRHFEPYKVVSEKISRDEKTGVSKEVGFARFESREIAEKVLADFHNATGSDGVKLLLRFADTKAQKLLKHQSNERRAYRADEYQYSVAVVNGSTPSPSVGHLPHAGSHISPSSQTSFQSPMPAAGHWTPATSISPTGQGLSKSSNGVHLNNNASWRSRSEATANNPDSTPSIRPRAGNQRQAAAVSQPSPADNMSTTSVKTVFPIASAGLAKSATSSPRKENIRSRSISPLARRENGISTPKSTC